MCCLTSFCSLHVLVHLSTRNATSLALTCRRPFIRHCYQCELLIDDECFSASELCLHDNNCRSVLSATNAHVTHSLTHSLQQTEIISNVWSLLKAQMTLNFEYWQLCAPCKCLFSYLRKQAIYSSASVSYSSSSFYLLRYYQIKHSSKYINMSRTYQARTCTYGSPVKVGLCAKSRYK